MRRNEKQNINHKSIKPLIFFLSFYDFAHFILYLSLVIIIFMIVGEIVRQCCKKVISPMSYTLVIFSHEDHCKRQTQFDYSDP